MSNKEDLYEDSGIKRDLKVALIILNKDNEKGLSKTLESLHNQSYLPCKYFDIFIMDGGSRDRSKEVALEFSKKIPCIYFIEQKVKGGTGPARREIIDLLREKDYQLIIWGDSENEYHSGYIESIVNRYLRERPRISQSTRIILSGRSVVKKQGIWSRFFYWYHGYHQIFPIGVGDRHAPGNNKAEEISIYNLFNYPPCSRSEDFIFSYQIYKRHRNKVLYLHEKNAVVFVSMPRSLKEIISWQRNRVKGLVECSRYIRYAYPPDLPYWTGFLLYNILLPLLAIITQSAVAGIFYLFTLLIGWIFLYMRGRTCLEEIDLLSGLTGYIGMILHAFFTLFYSLYYITKLRD
ncbi:MAG: glycosyltransferase family 2 protein [Sulfolobales archaeon]